MMVWPALQVSIMWRSGRKSFSPQFPVCHVQNLVEVQCRKHGIRYQQNCWKGWKSKSQGFRVSDFCFCCYVSKFLKQLLPPREQQEASGNYCQVKTVLQSQSWELAVEARRGGPPLQKFTWLEPVCQASLLSEGRCPFTLVFQISCQCISLAEQNCIQRISVKQFSVF